MCRIGYCPICKRHGLVLTKHHKWKRSVWGRNRKKNTKSIWICAKCHKDLELEIQKRENEILQQHPEIYIGTLNEFLKKGIDRDYEEDDIVEVVIKQKKTKKAKIRVKGKGDPASFPEGLQCLMVVD